MLDFGVLQNLVADRLRAGVGGDHDLFEDLGVVLGDSVELAVGLAGLGHAVFSDGLDLFGDAGFFSGGDDILGSGE